MLHNVEAAYMVRLHSDKDSTNRQENISINVKSKLPGATDNESQRGKLRL